MRQLEPLAGAKGLIVGYWRAYETESSQVDLLGEVLPEPGAHNGVVVDDRNSDHGAAPAGFGKRDALASVDAASGSICGAHAVAQGAWQ